MGDQRLTGLLSFPGSIHVVFRPIRRKTWWCEKVVAAIKEDFHDRPSGQSAISGALV
jgi:hypothetical protein